MNTKEQLYLEDEDWHLLLSILKQYPCKVHAFGSRTKKPSHKFSDIDLCIAGNIDLSELRQRFEESNLPMKVDVKHISDFSPEFLDLIKDDFVIVQAE